MNDNNIYLLIKKNFNIFSNCNKHFENIGTLGKDNYSELYCILHMR